MNRDELLQILSETQDRGNDKTLLADRRDNDIISEAIVATIDEATDEEGNKVNLEDVKDRLNYLVQQVFKAQKKAEELYEESLQEFEVEVCRTSYGFTTIKVEATSQEEAEALALDEAGSRDFNEKDADYKIV